MSAQSPAAAPSYADISQAHGMFRLESAIVGWGGFCGPVREDIYYRMSDRTYWCTRYCSGPLGFPRLDMSVRQAWPRSVVRTVYECEPGAGTRL